MSDALPVSGFEPFLAVQAAPTTPPRQEAVARWLLVLGMAIAAGLLAAAALILLDARQDVWQQAERSSTNLAQSLERDIARNFEIYDLSLIGAAEAFRQPGFAEADPALRRAAIFGRAISAKYMGSLLVLDAAGSIVFDSTSLTPPKLSLADRDYFQAQRGGDRGLFVSQPFRSRLSGGDPIVGISRRLSGPSGTFDGVVVGAVRLAYFDDMFRSLDLGRNGVVYLIDDAGRRLARYPETDKSIGRSFAGSPVADVVRAGTSGVVQGVAADGVKRLFAYQRIGTLPLHIAVGMSVDEFMAPWWRKAAVIGAILVGLAVAEVVMCLLFRSEMSRRLRAEASLRDAAHRLELAANTDALTGLANRRAFQAVLEKAWRTAVRNGPGLALLMIDADAVKKFNDRYGHQEGDRVLHLVGEAIRGTLSRAADLGARYGGEEFAVLLEHTDLDGACRVAERIRAELRAMAIPHADAPDGFVTVSIGAASCSPRYGQISFTLVRMADQALYDAKHAGRNRVCTAAALPRASAAAPVRRLAG